MFRQITSDDFLFAFLWAWGWFSIGFNVAIYGERKWGKNKDAE